MRELLIEYICGMVMGLGAIVIAAIGILHELYLIGVFTFLVGAGYIAMMVIEYNRIKREMTKE